MPEEAEGLDDLIQASLRSGYWPRPGLAQERQTGGSAVVYVWRGYDGLTDEVTCQGTQDVDVGRRQQVEAAEEVKLKPW